MRRNAHGFGCSCWLCTYRERIAPAEVSRELLANPLGVLAEQLERARPWSDERRAAAIKEAREIERRERAS